MTKYKLIYFKGCPNHLPAESLLKDVGLDFESVCQDNLIESDPMRNYSSPTLLAGDKIIFGSKALGGSCSMPLPTKEDLLKLI